MTKPSTFLGLRTVVYHVPDLARAKEWYTSALGIAPYFDQPYYVGFNVGGFELGLLPAEEGTPTGPGGSVAYWGVERMPDAWKLLVGLGAKPVSEAQDVGEGILVASLADPFGNVIGIIENPGFPNTVD